MPCSEVAEVAPQAPAAELGAEDPATSKHRDQPVEDPVHADRMQVAPEQEAVVVGILALLLDEVGHLVRGADPPPGR